MNELLALVISGGFFAFLGVVATLFFTRKKTQAETGKAQVEIRKITEESEQIKIENENMRAEQMNSVLRKNIELEKAREELKAKLYIANEEKLLLSKELQTNRIEKQKVIDELTENQKRFEELLTSQHKDIVEMKKKTGQLAEQLPGAMEHK